MTRSTRWILPLLLCMVATPVAAAGRLEINQACAIASGCFPGDNPGFPVQITSQNSYVLTSNLVPPNAAQAIDIQVDGVTIDLAGFTVGPCVNFPTNCATFLTADGIAGPSANDVTIRNGVVQDFRGSGVVLGRRALVEDLVILNNDVDGLRVLQNSLVLNNRIAFNAGRGASLGAGTGWGGNVFESNGTDASGNAYGISRNVCTGDPCGLVTGRRFYLSRTTATSANVTSVCDDGFRIATLLDLRTPGGLHYDEVRGVNVESAVNTYGWIEPITCGMAGCRGTRWEYLLDDNDFTYKWSVNSNLSGSTPRGGWCIEDN